MRLRCFKLCVVGLFLLSFSVFSAAPVQSPDNGATNKKTTLKAEPGKSNSRIIEGHVVGINIEKKEISVERNGKDYPISIEGSTQIMCANNPIALDKIKAGDLVLISYQRGQDGHRIALNVDNKTVPVAVGKKAALQEKATGSPAKNAAGPKAEVKGEPKKDVVAQPKVDAKAEPNKEVAAEAKAEVKAESKKDAAANPNVGLKTEPKIDSAFVKQTKTSK